MIHRFNNILSGLTIICLLAGTTGVSQAQIGPATGGPFGGPIVPANSPNVVDFDITPILNCASDNPIQDPIAFVCNTPLLEQLIDDLIQAEAFVDEVVIGYRNDMPIFFRNQLQEPLVIQVSLVIEDGPGGILATAAVVQSADFMPNPFLRVRGGFRAWSLPRLSVMSLDADDVPFLLFFDGMVDTIVHEAFHAMGHPTNFDGAPFDPTSTGAGLNQAINAFGQINFVGDNQGINGVGFGITEYREESGNPFANFVPLQQDLNDGNTPGHLNPFDPTFLRLDEELQEVFLPTAAPIGTQSFMSKALQGMFADLGYIIRGVNGPGFADIDLDGIEDDPLIINPALPTDVDP